MKCPTGKFAYETQEIAEEALIQNHIRNGHGKGAGPQNVYECFECSEWHFTSRLPTSPLLMDETIIKRIQAERRSLEWERRLR